jgi:hypothetical protein
MVVPRGIFGPVTVAPTVMPVGDETAKEVDPAAMVPVKVATTLDLGTMLVVIIE